MRFEIWGMVFCIVVLVVVIWHEELGNLLLWCWYWATWVMNEKI